MASKLSRSEQSKKEDDHGLRIVLVGKTGAGKSASGNTILGRQAFESKMRFAPVTEKCSKQEGQSGTRYVSIVDTPGLFGNMEKEEALKEIKKCISMSSPGPHVFLVVIRAGRFTAEESEAVNMIKMTFGKQAECYTMVLCTRGDDLEADGAEIEDLISEKEDLNAFVKQCKGGYHVFNNRVNRPSQVTELLKKINEMVMKNGGSNYTNALFGESEKAITEEMRKIMMEDPAMSEEEARKRAEKDNSFIRKTKFVVAGGAIGGVIGAVGGAAGGGGLVGAVEGAAEGFTAGAAVGAYVSDNCISQ